MCDTSCLICAEDFNNKKRKEIRCQYCSFTACLTCTQHYILDQELTICMNNAKNPDGTHICQKEWTRKYVVDNFPKSWVNKQWKNMNAKVGVDKEKALFPATMGVVKQRINLENLKNEIKLLSNKLDKYLSEFYKSENKLIKKILKTKINDLRSRLQNLRIQLRNGGDVAVEKSTTIGRKCPDLDCRGYLSSQWKCELCEKWTCPDCHVIKGNSRDSEHTCDPDTKATVKLLAKDTKPCPKCSTLIHKIEGCDQMWCTQCHTGFSWRRGTIENRIHNPHYYEWLRQNNGGTAPRNPGDYECGRDVTDYRFHRDFFSYLERIPFTEIIEETKSNIIKNAITQILRNTSHNRYISRNRFRVNNEDVNLENRVKYLRNIYDDKKFASMIHKNNKAVLKKRDIYNVLELQFQGTTDIMFRMYDKFKEWDSCDDKNLKYITHSLKIFKEFIELTKYSNTLLHEHSKTYGCKLYTLDIVGVFR
jgi:hypothetical protein